MNDYTQTPYQQQGQVHSPAAQAPFPYPGEAYQPDPFARSQMPYYGQNPQSRGVAWKPYAVGAAIAALLAVLIYQQVRIHSLSQAVGILDNNVRITDMRSRVSAAETRLNQVDARLRYLDSKIAATDRKSQSALDKLEKRGNLFTDLWNQALNGLGLNR